MILSPTRELAQQTFRECSKLTHGKKFKIVCLTKANANENTVGEQSSKRYHSFICFQL